MATTITRVTFSTLWNNYPRDPPCVDKDGKPPQGWENQCAVRVGVALERSGVSLKSLVPGGRCPLGPSDGPMVANAQRLANWLKSHPFPGCGRTRGIEPASWQAQLNNLTGIVFFQDYWRRKGETRGSGSGDHIDLWKKDTLTPSLASTLRFTLGITSFPNLNPFTRSEDNLNYYSDLGLSKQVWFWEVK